MLNDVITDQYQLLYGDCLLRMQEIPDASIDMILCDLPYGTTQCKWDNVIPFEPLWEQYRRVISRNGAIVLFSGQPFTSRLICSNLEMYKYSWIWQKENASNFFAAKFQPLNDTEDICVFSFGGCNNGSKIPCAYNPQGTETISKLCTNGKNVGGLVGIAHKTTMSEGRKYTQTTTGYPFKTLKFSRDSGKEHPTQKPVALLEYLIHTYTNDFETVLDNTMGSCSTGVSCLNTNRKFIGIESNEGYFEISCKRMEEKTEGLIV